MTVLPDLTVNGQTSPYLFPLELEQLDHLIVPLSVAPFLRYFTFMSKENYMVSGKSICSKHKQYFAFQPYKNGRNNRIVL